MLTRLLFAWALLALLGVAVWGSTWIVKWSPPASLVPEVATVSLGTREARTGRMEEVLRRPPFWPSRRPEVGASETAPASLDGIRLIGVAVSAAQAMVLIEQAGRSSRLLVGDEIAGHRLEGIEDGNVVLRAADGERVAIPIPRTRLDGLPIRPGSQ